MFLEQQLDKRITMGALFTDFMPGISRVRSADGKLQVNYAASRSIVRAEMKHGVGSPEQYQTLVDAWFIVTQTPYEGLRVRNPRDYRATRTNTAVRSLGGGAYQLQRRHTFGGINVDVDIKKPISSGLVIYAAGGTVLTATLDDTTGIITGVSGTPATWSGLFDIPMTFSDDEWSAELQPGNGGDPCVVSGQIRMEELILP